MFEQEIERKIEKFREIGIPKYISGKQRLDGFVKSLETIIPDSIRHSEPIEITGFRFSPE